MIDFLRGKVAHREPEYAVIDVHGVGYRVFCPNPFALPDKTEDITVYIHHHVREDAILLFGFPTREEQALFRRLLDVSGIGPKVALGMLSGARPEAIVAAVQQENVTFLTKLPGIGKKNGAAHHSGLERQAGRGGVRHGGGCVRLRLVRCRSARIARRRRMGRSEGSAAGARVYGSGSRPGVADG